MQKMTFCIFKMFLININRFYQYLSEFFWTFFKGKITAKNSKNDPK
jgi:hypothetical protein